MTKQIDTGAGRLGEFWMEDWLEKNRFSARYNAGESGHRPLTLRDLLLGLQPCFDFDLKDAFFDVPLNDAPNMGSEELRQQVALLHPCAGVENILITTGTSEAFYLLMRQLSPQRVAVITPAFQLLVEVPRALGAELISLPIAWSENRSPLPDLENWKKIIRKTRPQVLILNHPHNPTGVILSPSELSSLIAEADEVGCTVVGDEHYRFLHPESAIGPTVYGKGRFVTGSFIKCCGVPGLRIGWCVGDPQVLEAMQSEKNYLTHTVNPLSQKLSYWFLKSLAHGESLFHGLRMEWMSNRVHLHQWLQTQDVWRGQAPAGGLVSCLFSEPSREVSVVELLKQNEIFLLPLSTFNDGHVGDSSILSGYRVGLGLPSSHFKEMLSVMVP